MAKGRKGGHRHFTDAETLERERQGMDRRRGADDDDEEEEDDEGDGGRGKRTGNKMNAQSNTVGMLPPNSDEEEEDEPPKRAWHACARSDRHATEGASLTRRPLRARARVCGLRAAAQPRGSQRARCSRATSRRAARTTPSPTTTTTPTRARTPRRPRRRPSASSRAGSVRRSRRSTPSRTQSRWPRTWSGCGWRGRSGRSRPLRASPPRASTGTHLRRARRQRPTHSHQRARLRRPRSEPPSREAELLRRCAAPQQHARGLAPPPRLSWRDRSSADLHRLERLRARDAPGPGSASSRGMDYVYGANGAAHV